MKKTGKRWQSRSARLVAVGTLAVSAAAGASVETGKVTAEGTDQKATQAPVRKFEIAAGPLAEALTLFERQSGLQVDVKLRKGGLDGLSTQGVSGSLTNEEGLRRLLLESGLSSRMTGPGSAEISVGSKDSVDVRSTLSNSVSMGKFTESLLDTPQTVAVVPQFVLKDEQNTTLRDALRNVPGISMAAGEFGAQGDNLTIRGFTARNDIFLDGIRDFGSYYRDSFNYDQVEVLEGPAGVQFGRGSTGGVINQESKVAGPQPFVNVQTQFGTDATRRVSADINEPLDDVMQGAAFRVNAVGTEGGVAGRPYAANRHYGVAPTLAFGLNSKLRTNVGYFHVTESDVPDYGLPWLYNKLSPAGRHSYFGLPDSNYLKANVDMLTGKADYDIAPHIALRTIARWGNSARNAQITEPQICSNASVSVPVGGYVRSLPTSSVTGKTCTYTPATPASQITVNRNQLQVRSVEGILWDQTEMTARFKVLGVQNALVGGVEGGQEISNPVRTSYTISGLNSVPSTNLANPNTQDVFSGTGYIASVTHAKSKSVGLYFVDTLHLGKLFELSGGVRWDYFNTDFKLVQPVPPPPGGAVTASIGPLAQTLRQPTYRAAFVYKPTSHGSVYFDYGTSFNPSAETLALSVSSSVLPPEENETYEVGAKYSFFAEHLMLDGAWFRTTKLNARESDPTNSNNIVLAGNQMVKGVQASAVGRLRSGTDLVLGYAYLQSEVTFSRLYPTSIGYGLANVPKQTFNAFLSQRVPGRVRAGLGGNYVASRLASSTVPYVPLTFSGPVIDPANPTVTSYQVLSTGIRQVPGYWVFNAMVSRPVTDRIELQANVYNVLNRYYIDQPHPSHLIPGAGASALIGATFRF